MKKVVSIFWIMALCLTAHGQEAQPPPATKPEFTFTAKIAEARELLRNIPLERSKTLVAQKQYIKVASGRRCKGCKRRHGRVYRKKVVKYTDHVRKQAALAVLNKKTGEIKTFKIEKNSSALINLSSEFNVSFEPRHSGITWNGKNTAFMVTSKATGEQWIVVHIKWVEKITGYDSRDVLYVPYSRALHQPELVKLGAEHLDRVISLARQGLDAKNVRSLAFPAKKVTEVIPAEFNRRLSLDEHTDPSEADAFLDGDLKEDPFHRVWVRLGTNGYSEFAESRSKASARGLTQFIQGTWNVVRRVYPLAQLPEFIPGTSNQVTATQAEWLLEDYNLDQLVRNFGPGIAQDPELEAYLAAGYNGGIGRVIRGIKRSKAGWRDKLMPETKDYLEKLDYLIEHDKKDSQLQSPTMKTNQ